MGFEPQLGFDPLSAEAEILITPFPAGGFRIRAGMFEAWCADTGSTADLVALLLRRS